MFWRKRKQKPTAQSEAVPIGREWKWYGHANPLTMETASIYGETYDLGPPLDSYELDLFKAQFMALLPEPGSEERRLMLNRVEQYILALRAIKTKLNGPGFSGLSPEDTKLGFGLIRPVFTKLGKIKAIQVSIDGKPSPRIPFGMCITHLKWAYGKQTLIVPISTIILTPGRDTVYLTQSLLNIVVAQNDKVALGGLVYGLGADLRHTTWKYITKDS